MWISTLGKEPSTQGKVCMHVDNGEIIILWGRALPESSYFVLFVNFVYKHFSGQAASCSSAFSVFQTKMKSVYQS